MFSAQGVTWSSGATVRTLKKWCFRWQVSPATWRLSDVTLALEPFSAVLVSGQHHPFAIEIECTAPEVVNCCFDVKHLAAPRQVEQLCYLASS
jgi:hypothetical protein